jgi:AcrR family transcriptional regulator
MSTISLATRERIFAATRALLSKKGIDAVSMRAVAEAAGISAGAIYRHYPNKDALVTEIVTEAHKQLQTVLWQALAKHPVGSLPRIAELGAVYMSFARRAPDDYLLLFGPQSGTLRPFGGSAAQDAITIALECIRDAMKSGAMKKADPMIVALHLWGRLHGLIMLSLTFDFSKDYPEFGKDDGLEVIFERTRSFVYDGLRRKQS